MACNHPIPSEWMQGYDVLFVRKVNCELSRCVLEELADEGSDDEDLQTSSRGYSVRISGKWHDGVERG